MKQILKKDFALLLSEDKAPLISKARKPKPFPGKYPTRVLVGIDMKDGFQVQYFGKSSWNVYKLIRKAFASRDFKGSFCIAEFDRGGIIYARFRPSRRHDGWTRQNPKLWRFYHPHSGADSSLTWMGHKAYAISIKRNGVYGPGIPVLAEEF